MKTGRLHFPSTSALIAFETAARHCNFSRAAQELNTSQSAVSRHIADMEARIGVRLFDRKGKSLTLNDNGEHFRRAVSRALDTIRTAAEELSPLSSGDDLTIACTHEISHLYLLPRFEALQRAIGEDRRIRIMTYEYDSVDQMRDPRIDLTFVWQSDSLEDTDQAALLCEAIVPVCAPAYFSDNRTKIEAGPAQWHKLTLLDLAKRNMGWAGWQDWFGARGAPPAAPRTISYANYVYLLEAAANGKGIALGWQGMIERQVEAGTLVPVAAEPLVFNRWLQCVLTPRGKGRAVARDGLAFFREAGLEVNASGPQPLASFG